MEKRCWCGNKLEEIKKDKLIVYQCPLRQSLIEDRKEHILEVIFPAGLLINYQGIKDDLEEIYRALFDNRTIPLSLLQRHQVRLLMLSFTIPCLETDCSGRKFYCSTTGSSFWLGNCGHRHNIYRWG